MKKVFRACLMCMSMFLAIPIPIKKWDEEARPLMTLFLPLVGAVVGGLWMLLSYLLRLLDLPVLIAAAALTAYPFLITGGMHFDGFLDTVDAVKSWRGPEERRRIIKDPHVGSFAVIAAVLLVMAQFAFFASVKEEADIFTLLLIPVVSRITAALAVTLLRPISVSEYAGAYQKGIRKSHVVILAVLYALVTAAGFVFLGKYGFAAIAVTAGYLLFLIRGFRSLNGMSGDISGYALVCGELAGIAVYALV
ncbi:MAG: adenosylcobinamide-GDP ribazoletransferase [Lachnospiraceae bacterium]|nr:adenosylcobinamide-GDP ribazoletransferase [Lachnospiraceae bacterium]